MTSCMSDDLKPHRNGDLRVVIFLLNQTKHTLFFGLSSSFLATEENCIVDIQNINIAYYVRFKLT